MDNLSIITSSFAFLLSVICFFFVITIFLDHREIKSEQKKSIMITDHLFRLFTQNAEALRINFRTIDKKLTEYDEILSLPESKDPNDIIFKKKNKKETIH